MRPRHSVACPFPHEEVTVRPKMTSFMAGRKAAERPADRQDRSSTSLHRRTRSPVRLLGPIACQRNCVAELKALLTWADGVADRCMDALKNRRVPSPDMGQLSVLGKVASGTAVDLFLAQ